MKHRFVLCIIILLLAGCNLVSPDSAATPISVAVPLPTATPQPVIPTPDVTQLPGGLEDMLPIMSGICFEAAWDSAGQVFILRRAEDHINLYDLADQSRLCRLPVTRYPFDFSHGDVLAGLWTRGAGCVAHHDITGYQRDDSAKTIHIALTLIVEGDCPYELVRPFWVSIPMAQDYEITIEVRE